MQNEHHEIFFFIFLLSYLLSYFLYCLLFQGSPFRVVHLVVHSWVIHLVVHIAVVHGLGVSEMYRPKKGSFGENAMSGFSFVMLF